MRIIGKDRHLHSPAVVADAEAELRALWSSSGVDAAANLRLATRVSLLLGLAWIFSPLALLNDFDLERDLASRMIRFGFVFQAILGVVLTVGGVGLWRRRAWGVSAGVLVIRTLMAYVLIFHLYVALEATRGAGAALGTFLLVLVVLFTALWWTVLQRAVRFLTEPALLALLEQGARKRAG